MTHTAYDDFLRAKVALPEEQGFPCEPHEVHPLLKAHQVAMVCWAVRGGRRALFAAFGLGKSVMQLEIVRLTRAKAGGMGLIVIPLGVRYERRRHQHRRQPPRAASGFDDMNNDIPF